jgi:hypothetical protein
MKIFSHVLVCALSVWAEELTESSTTTLIPNSIEGKVRPQFTVLSYLAGLVVMLIFVVLPVGMMAYRNRNSIVEFIKNR